MKNPMPCGLRTVRGSWVPAIVLFLLALGGIAWLYDVSTITAVMHARTAHLNTVFIFLTKRFTAAVFFLFFLIPVGRQKKFRFLLFLVVGEIALLGINEGVKYAVARPRPFHTLPAVAPLTPARGYSFPSHHATAAFYWAMMMGMEYPLLSPLFFLAAAGFALIRLYVGVHYLSDLVGGALLAYLFFLATQAWMRKKGQGSGKGIFNCPFSPQRHQDTKSIE